MNVALHPHPAPMTTEAFLAWPGDGSGRRFNLVDGVARPMSPASHTHAQLQSNALALIARSIDAAGLDLSALVEGAVVPDRYPARNVRVPDNLVTAAPDAPGQVAILNPVLIVEILSPGNQAQTRDNLRAYASLSSMQELVAIHSQRISVEVQRRDAGGSWATETLEAGSDLILATVALRCPVSALYRRTWLAQEA